MSEEGAAAPSLGSSNSARPKATSLTSPGRTKSAPGVFFQYAPDMLSTAARAWRPCLKAIVCVFVGVALTYASGAYLVIKYGNCLQLELLAEHPDVASWPYPRDEFNSPRASFTRLRSTWSDYDKLATSVPFSLYGRSYGWPLRILKCWQNAPSTSAMVRKSAWHWGMRISKSGGIDPVIPLCPVWPGFAITTLFYAALAWGLWQVPLCIRRRYRMKRNRCTRCGYSLAGLAVAGTGAACPECGLAAGRA
jgi:hypothetical protein